MFKKALILFLTLSFYLGYADEGLWVPLFLKGYPINQMQARGLKLSAEDIYSINHSSLKDAVLQFGGGCTGSVISPEGLVLTNYHCGYSYIVNHSSVEKDYLTNGFWAASMEEELPNPGLKVTFLVYMEDVTDKILPKIPKNASELQRKAIVEILSKKIADSVERHWNHKYNASVKAFYYGNQYILMVTQTFRDVRLVAAPPSAIGKFGGETDNWMWPRHTGDFSLFRIYVNKNNEPADYSPDNIPYRPKKFLKISLKGYRQGDFTMVMGYPGYTQEYVPSYTVRNVMNVVDPLRIKIRQAKLDVILPALNRSTKLRLMYAKRSSRIANGWKKWQGEIKGLRRLAALKKKREFERRFEQWTKTSQGKSYAGLLQEYKKLYKHNVPYQRAYYAYIETVFFNDVFNLAKKLRDILLKMDNSLTGQEFDSLRIVFDKQISSFAKNHDYQVERKILNNTLRIYVENIDSSFVPGLLYDLNNESQSANLGLCKPGIGDLLFAKSLILSGKYDDYLVFGKKKRLEKLQNDVLLALYRQFGLVILDKVLSQVELARLKLDSLNRLYMKAQMLFDSTRHFYPDANLTLRVSYGTIQGYEPRDAVNYNYYTTASGILEKDDPDIYDYRVPDKLKQLIENRDFGRYADKDSTMHVCFIANNHTTGGNSGSPVLDANGNLIGLNFDRTWETTMSDLFYSPEICRNISVDIRYILFLIDKFAKDKRIINELVIVR